MNIETKKFFRDLGLQIREIYGMTEVVVISLSLKESSNLESNVGKCIDEAQTQILRPDKSGQGEICVRGRQVFMGYINDEQKTREILDDDRWLHTGDYGFIDREGFIHITGRIKEIIITSGGENISPLFVENFLKAECPALSNVFLVGDKRKFLSVLVTLKTQVDCEGSPTDDLAHETIKWLQDIGKKEYKKLSEILIAGPDSDILKTLQTAIDNANKNSVSNAQRIQKFVILPQDFSFSTGELGPSLKLKRNVVLKKYNDIIDKLYDC